MIVEPVRVTEGDGRVERAATVRSTRGEFRLSIAGPPDLIDRSTDASGFLAVALPLAMRLGEELRVEGPVSPHLLDRCHEIQALYAAWGPFMRRIAIGAEADAQPARSGTGNREVVGFFSRGVDSVFMAARDRACDHRFASLIFGDGLEPKHDAGVRAHEMRLASLQAERLGLPMRVVETNLRLLTDPIVHDWEDMCGAGLSFVAHGIAGGAHTAHIAATDTYESVEPAGTSPLLDPMFSTERVTLVHDTLAFSRLDKIRWLAAHCPDAIADLKVCYAENRSDNCGRCGKCMITMAALHVAGVLHESTQFPHELDLEAISHMRLPVTKALVDWAEFARLDDDRLGGRLRAAARAALFNSVKHGHGFESERGPLWIEPRSMRTHHMNLVLGLLLDGEPYPDIAPPKPRRPIASWVAAARRAIRRS